MAGKPEQDPLDELVSLNFKITERQRREFKVYRVMRIRLKAKGHTASPRTALDLMARIQRHQAKIGDRAVEGLSTTTPEQLELFDTLNLPKPA